MSVLPRDWPFRIKSIAGYDGGNRPDSLLMIVTFGNSLSLHPASTLVIVHRVRSKMSGAVRLFAILTELPAASAGVTALLHATAKPFRDFFNALAQFG